MALRSLRIPGDLLGLAYRPFNLMPASSPEVVDPG
jgi:hypothetical protein